MVDVLIDAVPQALALASYVVMFVAIGRCLSFSVRYAFDKKYRKKADADIDQDGFGSHF